MIRQRMNSLVITNSKEYGSINKYKLILKEKSGEGERQRTTVGVGVVVEEEGYEFLGDDEKTTNTAKRGTGPAPSTSRTLPFGLCAVS